jgi:D-alanine-D-alanine ligase
MTDAARARKPPVVVLYNENPDWPQADKDWADEMVTMMVDGLREQRYVFETVKYFDDLSALDKYDPREWLVWNWGEELAGQPWSEAHVAEVLEQRGFVFTGATAETFRATQSRMQVKQRLEAAGLPTLAARVLTDPGQAAEWKLYPAIVKGANQHASYGISRDSVVENSIQLARRVAYLREAFADDALVEPFLDTREFHVAVWGNHAPEALPPLEFDYSVFSDMRDRLYTYDWKFDRDSRGFNEIKMPCPAPLDRPDWQARLEAVAVRAYRALGLRDYGRLDLRMLGDEPQILDVNPNPDLDVTSVLPAGARALGLSYGEMIDRIIGFAAERLPGAAAPAEG